MAIIGIIGNNNGGAGGGSGSTGNVGDPTFGWGYQDFPAGTIASTNVVISDNQNGTIAFDSTKVLDNTAVIVLADNNEEKPYTGTTKLFSQLVNVSNNTGVSVNLSGIPNSTWGNVRVYYYYRYEDGLPDGYTIAPKNVSGEVLNELNALFITEEEFTAVETNITNISGSAAFSNSNGAANQIAFFTSSNEISGGDSFTYDGSSVTIENLEAETVYVGSLSAATSGNLLTWDANSKLVDSGVSSADVTTLQAEVASISGEDFILTACNRIRHVESGSLTELPLVPTLTDNVTASGIGPTFGLSSWFGLDVDYISNKELSKCRFSEITTSQDGEVALNGDGKLILRRNTTDEIVLSGFSIAPDYNESSGYDFEWYDIEPFSISLFNGDSDYIGLNAVPLVVGMTRGIGAYPTVPKLEGSYYD